MNAEELAQKVARRITASERIASRYFEERYARLLFAMSLPEAQRILGVAPNATPDDITKAYKTMAFKYHPDRGGDPQQMVLINVARDVLLKGGPGRYTPPPYKSEPRPTKVRWEDDPETKIVNGQSFAQAMGNSGAPANTVWKFVSVTSYYWKASYYPGDRIWVLYGQTETQHVFLGLKYRPEGNGVIPTEEYGPKTHFMDDWQSSEIEAPLSQDPLKIIPKCLKTVASGWADGAVVKGPTKFIAWSGGAPTAETMKKIPHSGGVVLKDIIVGTGVVKGGVPGVGDRKTQVEIITLSNREKRKRNLELLKEKKIPRMTVADQYDFIVRINGKEQLLADETVRNMEKKVIPWSIGWDNIDDKRVTNLTRKRGMRGYGGGAAFAILGLVDCLTTEPSWVHLALEKAAEEHTDEEGNPKKAALLHLSNENTLFETAMIVGSTPFEVYQELYGPIGEF
jgi:hypothetical protein